MVHWRRLIGLPASLFGSSSTLQWSALDLACSACLIMRSAFVGGGVGVGELVLMGTTHGEVVALVSQMVRSFGVPVGTEVGSAHNGGRQSLCADH